MLAIIRSLDIAGIGAGLRSVTLGLAEREVLVSHISIVAVAVIGGVDGTAEFGGAIVAVDGRRWGVFIVG